MLHSFLLALGRATLTSSALRPPAATVAVAVCALGIAVGLLRGGGDEASAQSAAACAGDVSGGFPQPQPTSRRLLFGIFPGGQAGAVFGPQQQAKPEQPARVVEALTRLREGRPFVAHVYLNWNNGPEVPTRVQAVREEVDRYRRAGIATEIVITYRPRLRRGEADVADFIAFVRETVRGLGARRGVKSIQVTNEVNNSLSPDASDGAYPAARDALVQGIPAAKDEARKRGLDRLAVGFNWFYRTDPGNEDEFWTYLRDRGGPPFASALDWVGLDAYPGTYFPPGGVSRGNSMLNALSLLRECYLPYAGIAASVPIHVTENGWPTGPGRSYAEQEAALREMTRAVCDYRANYNVTDFRWFSLRDGNSSAPDFQQQYGLLRDDYSPKPAFEAYRQAIAGCGVPPAAARSAPRLRLTVRPRRVRAQRRVRFRFRVTRRVGGRARPVRRALVRFAGKRARTGRRGRARIVTRFRRPGRRRARAVKRGYRPGVARVRVLRPRPVAPRRR
jgi:hypothetical protein